MLAGVIGITLGLLGGYARGLVEILTVRSMEAIVCFPPILLALPGAAIVEIQDDGAIVRTTYDDALPVRLTRDFLTNPRTYLRHLLDESG